MPTRREYARPTRKEWRRRALDAEVDAALLRGDKTRLEVESEALRGALADEVRLSVEARAVAAGLESALADANAATLACLANLEECRSPEPEPEPGALVLPGTGEIIAQDLALEPNPSKVYGGQHSPESDGYEEAGQEDSFYEVYGFDGDPHVPIGLSLRQPRWRRFHALPGVQSIYDKRQPPDPGGTGNGATRTQAETWTTTRNPMAFSTGRVLHHYYSFRLQSPTVLPHDQARGGGLSKYTQLVQFKAFGDRMRTHLPFTCTVGRDGIKFIVSRGAEVPQTIVPVPNGEWIRMGLSIDWSRDGGYIAYLHRPGDDGLVAVAEETGIDMSGGRPSAAPGIGPYHYLTLLAEPYYCDYANVQICETV